MGIKRLEQLEELMEKSRLVCVKKIQNQRGATGAIIHYSFSAENMNNPDTHHSSFVEEDDEDIVARLFDWTERDQVEISSDDTEVNEEVFSFFKDDGEIDLNTVIWKYMDLSKFLSLLMTNSLWFARLDNNWSVDPLEGKVPNLQYQEMEKRISLLNWAPVYEGENAIQIGGEPNKDMVEVPKKEVVRRELGMNRRLYDAVVYNSYVDCWNVSEHESYHMWKLYCGHDNGIGIKSTIGNLISSLGNNKSYSVKGGMVDYIDPKIEKPSRENNLSSHVFSKSKPYLFENEFRLCVSDNGFVNELFPSRIPFSLDSSQIQSLLGDYLPGVKVPIDLNELIQKIYVSPQAAPWFKGILEMLIKEPKARETNFGAIASKVVSASDMSK